MSNILEVKNNDDLNGLLEEGGDLVVLFHAPAWCRPCNMLKPHYHALPNLLPRVTFAEVDIDNADREFVNEYNVLSVPTLLFFSEGRERATLVSRTAIALVDEIKSLVEQV